MSSNRHFDNCEAPLCQEADNREAIWYPGESVCNLKPYTKFQKKQININNLLSIGKYKGNPETPLTYEKLNK